MKLRKKLPPIHPGTLLRDELDEIGVSLNERARAIRVPMNRISAIVNWKRAITVDTAMRLARYSGASPQYWLNLQIAYELEVAGERIQAPTRAGSAAANGGVRKSELYWTSRAVREQR
jgi:addiction module HigA family antidote